MINYLKKIYYEKYTKTSYSISNVDLVIERIFKNKNDGIYIDVGCNHPIKYNNTYLLYKKGWHGLNIDLDKKSIDQFNKLRKRDINILTLVTSCHFKLSSLHNPTIISCANGPCSSPSKSICLCK